MMARQKHSPLVGVVMGSDSDWEIMEHAVLQLTDFGVPYEAKVLSAHRTPDAAFAYAERAASPASSPARAAPRIWPESLPRRPCYRCWASRCRQSICAAKIRCCLPCR